MTHSATKPIKIADPIEMIFLKILNIFYKEKAFLSFGQKKKTDLLD